MWANVAANYPQGPQVVATSKGWSERRNVIGHVPKFGLLIRACDWGNGPQPVTARMSRPSSQVHAAPRAAQLSSASGHLEEKAHE